MTRTPDEIKKGLEHAAIDCRDAHDCDKTCAYYKECTNFDYEITEVPCTMLFDALALIQQLQDDNAQQARCIENMTDKLNAANDEVAKLKAERDAAVADMITASVNSCDVCKSNELIIDEAPCQNCMHIFKGRESKFEWRGVQKEE